MKATNLGNGVYQYGHGPHAQIGTKDLPLMVEQLSARQHRQSNSSKRAFSNLNTQVVEKLTVREQVKRLRLHIRSVN